MSISTKMSAFLVLLIISQISALPTPSNDTTSDLAFSTNVETKEKMRAPRDVGDDSGR